MRIAVIVFMLAAIVSMLVSWYLTLCTVGVRVFVVLYSVPLGACPSPHANAWFNGGHVWATPYTMSVAGGVGHTSTIRQFVARICAVVLVFCHIYHGRAMLVVHAMSW